MSDHSGSATERTRDWRAYVMALVPLAWLALPAAGMLMYGPRR